MLFLGRDLLGRLMSTYQFDSILQVSCLLLLSQVFHRWIRLLSRLPIYRLASVLLDRDSPMDATNKKGTLIGNRRKEHIRRGHPKAFGPLLTASILFTLQFWVFFSWDRDRLIYTRHRNETCPQQDLSTHTWTLMVKLLITHYSPLGLDKCRQDDVFRQYSSSMNRKCLLCNFFWKRGLDQFHPWF